jgi:hypothetical protein
MHCDGQKASLQKKLEASISMAANLPASGISVWLSFKGNMNLLQGKVSTFMLRSLSENHYIYIYMGKLNTHEYFVVSCSEIWMGLI